MQPPHRSGCSNAKQLDVGRLVKSFACSGNSEYQVNVVAISGVLIKGRQVAASGKFRPLPILKASAKIKHLISEYE